MKKIVTNLMPALAAVILTAAGALAGPFAVDDAVPMDDDRILGWATGYENYIPGTDVWESWQTPDKALGQAQGTSGDIVCLGDGGRITLTFAAPIANGEGADFAVFENSFSAGFLELAYVAVSSDGEHFVRFTNYSLTQNPVGGFDESMDASEISGLAGKYMQGLGTPFDLSDLETDPLLDINNIGYVRILDIVGDGTCVDSLGNVIWDPDPTFQSAGFDLDAIAVLNQGEPPAVPVPGAALLLASGLAGLAGTGRRNKG